MTKDQQKTVLKDEQIDQIRRSMQPWQLMNEFARAIEQAALQSPEVQAWKKDAERWNLFRAHWRTANIRNDPKTGNFKSATVTLSSDRGRFQAPLDDMADTILAAMEKQK